MNQLLTKRILRNFAYSQQISRLSSYKTGPFMGCIIIVGNTILSIGYNTMKEHTLQKKYNANKGFDTSLSPNTLHAEICALSKLKYKKFNQKKIEIYIYREHKNGNLALAKPCVACFAAIKDFNINKIYYTGYNCFMCMDANTGKEYKLERASFTSTEK